MADKDESKTSPKDEAEDKPVSLDPLGFEDAVEGLLEVKPKKKGDPEPKKPKRKKK